MALKQIIDRIVDTDVLVVGGGIAGCCAAWKATEKGLNVTLAEKAHVDRSGQAALGCDDFGPVPGNGATALDLLRWRQQWITRRDRGKTESAADERFFNLNPTYRAISNMPWAIEELERMGVTCKWDDGKLYWVPAGPFPPDVKTYIRIHWQNCKPDMGKACRKAGVNVLNRTMLVDLLTNKGRIVGATALNVRTGEFIVIKAKAVFISTGRLARLYNPTPPHAWAKVKMRYHEAPNAGEAEAAALRAGAELSLQEMWGLNHMRDDVSAPGGVLFFGEGVPARAVTWDGKELPRIPGVQEMDEYERKGMGPIYWGLEGKLPEDFYKRREVSTADERIIALYYGEQRGFNFGTHRYQRGNLRPGAKRAGGGIVIDENFATGVKGLFAGGNCATGIGGVAMSSCSGYLFAESMTKFVSEAGEPDIDEAQVESQKQVLMAPLAVKDGADAIEVEMAVRGICEEYAPLLLSEGRLREGLKRLGTLKRVFVPKLAARNPHELMRCAETRDLILEAELLLRACLERKETRSFFNRLDYPEQDPSLVNKTTYQRLENGKVVTEIREVPDLKEEYVKGVKK